MISPSTENDLVQNWADIDVTNDDVDAESNNYESSSPLFNNIIDPFNSYLSPESQETRVASPMNAGGVELSHQVEVSSDTTMVVDDDDDDNIKSIGLMKIPQQEFKRIAKDGTEFTILVAGDRGLGKTTFINTLYEPFEEPEIEESIELENPTVNFTTYQSILDDGNFKLTLRVIDTPGFFDTTNNKFCWVPIASYIDALFRLRYFQEEQPDRSKLSDSRIHACVYFISPIANGLSESNITCMKNLCDRVNLIPVISKADSFTKDQITKFKKLAWISIKENDIKLCSMLDIEASKMINWEILPFSIICADSYVQKSNGEIVRGRAYNWGIAEVENESHCDFNQLKELLMSEHMMDLIESTENLYEKFRTKMMYSRLEQKLQIDKKKNHDFDEDENITGLENALKEELILKDNELITNYGFNFEDSFKCIEEMSCISWKIVEQHFAEQNLIYLERQLQIKKNFASIVSMQEKKFKEWKGALIIKQKLFNKEIHDLHKQIINLQENIKKNFEETSDIEDVSSSVERGIAA